MLRSHIFLRVLLSYRIENYYDADARLPTFCKSILFPMIAQECALSRRLSERVRAAEAEAALLRQELLESHQALSGNEEELEDLRTATKKWEVGSTGTPYTLTWSKRATSCRQVIKRLFPRACLCGRDTYIVPICW